MKNTLLCLLVFSVLGALSVSVVHAQVGIGTETPSPKAVLELQSPGNNQGFLVPRLTSTQRNAIAPLGTSEKGLLVFDSTVDRFYYWSGTTWIVIEDTSGTGTVTNITTGGGLTGGPITVSGIISLADGGVTTVKIANNNVTSAKILDGTIVTADLGDGAITDVKVTTVAPIKLTADGATTGQVLKWNGTNWTPQADASGSGTVTNIATGTGLTGGPITATGTISLADGGVTTVKIADNNVTSAKILDGTIATGDLANGSVTTAKILDGTIVTADLADVSVTDVKIAALAPGKITQAGASTGQVLKWSGTAWTPQADDAGAGTLPTLTSGQLITSNGTGNIAVTVSGDATFASSGSLTIANNAITTTKILDGTIATADLANGSVTTAKILDGTIATADLADASVTDVKIAALAPGKITQAGASTGEVLKWSGTAWTPQADAGGSGTVTNIATGTGLTGGPITTTGTISLADGGVTTVKIADSNVTTAKILDGTIAAGDLANGSVTSAKILDGTIATADLADVSVTDAKISALAPGKITQAGASTGYVLKWSGSAWTPQADGTGTDAQTLSFTSPNLSISGGNSVNLSAINTDAQALAFTPATGLLAISGGNNVTITGTVPGGAAGADLTGTYPNPTITNGAVSSAKILDGTIATADLADNAITSAKVADGTLTNADISATAGIAVTKVAAGTNGQVLTTVAGSTAWAAAPAASGAAGGDLAGTFPSPTVDGLQGRPVTATLPAANDVLKWNGTAWAPGADATGGGGVGGGGAATQVAYWGSATNIGGKSSFVYDDKNDRLGVNTPSPLGNLHVTGSQFVSTTVVPSGNTYTVTASDYLIYGEPNPSGGSLTVTLPPADPNKGRILIIRTSGNTSKKNVVRVTPSGSDTIDGIASYATLNATVGSVYAVILVSVGSGWQTISKSIF